MKVTLNSNSYSWEQRKLEKLGKIETGNTPATSNLEYYSDTGLLWITPTDMTSNITTKTVKYLSDKGEKVARVIPANSTLCTCIASIGKNTFCPVKCAFNQQINALSPNNSNDPYFIFTDSYHWSITMKKGAGGLTFQIVNKTEFSSIETYIPSKQEQVKIGQLFYRLDSLITLHQRKLIFLKSHRFQMSVLFCYSWEQRKLNEMVSYTSSSLSAKDAVDDGKWNLYDANQLIGKTNLFFVRDDYITIIKDGAGVGRVRLLPKNSAFIGTMGALLSFNSDLLFDYALLTKADLSSKFSGSTIPHIYFKDYGNEIYRVPSLFEQQKIGALFEHLDSLITLHQRKQL